MQTFLPYESFLLSAKCLDYKRLGKQRVEARQIIKIVTGEDKNSRWRNHPAVRMWQGYATCLKMYYNTIVLTWISRGYRNSMPFYKITIDELLSCNYPEWLKDERFHKSHRSNLLRKDKKYYSQFNWDVPNNMDYVWPV